MIDPVIFFGILLKAALLSTGGLGSLPAIHQDLLLRGWASDRQFATALAVGQLASGPTGLWMVALGYLVYGLPGAFLTTIAASLPPLLVLPLGQAHRRVAGHPAVRGFVRGLVLAVASSIPFVMLKLIGNGGLGATGVGIVIGGALLIASRRLPLVVTLGLGAAAGMALLR